MLSKLSLWLMVVCLWVGNAFGAKYYIDFSAGADTNLGTSKTVPWKHVKGMNGKATDKAAAHTLVSGDTMIFKGGVVWDSTCFPETIGTVGRVAGLAFTVDSSWYSGGSYARPVFDFMLKQHGPTTNDALIYANYKDGFVMRGLEFKNAKGPATGKANAVHIYCYGADNTLWEDLYVHDWRPSRAGNNGDESGWCGCLIFNDCSTTVVRNCIMTGVDSGGSGVRFFGTANTWEHINTFLLKSRACSVPPEKVINVRIYFIRIRSAPHS
jgi:hypothetical protein